jgi:protein-S-isoprenylcysteine O-methyltransferase
MFRSEETMNIPPPEILGPFMGLSEFLLSVFKRSGKNAVSKDRNSLTIIWVVYGIAIFFGVFAAYHLYQCRLPWPDLCLDIGYIAFVLGTLLRWYSIIYLGRFFTTNVAIASDHRVIDTGPYRYIRHPSYAGAMLALLGFSLSFQNWASALIIFIPCFTVNQWRIRIEEKALSEALGEPYRIYMQRTKRLIPFVF